MRIAHNNPPPERLAMLLAEEGVEALRRRVRDRQPIAGPTEQWIDQPPDAVDRSHTTSMSIADRDGNIVCITQSLGAKFGCGVVVPGHGVCLNNFLYWGEVNPKGTNFLRPNQSLALPMAPSIATRQGRAVLALGTPGSYGICQTQSQVMVQHVDFGLELQAAIEAPRARLLDDRLAIVESRIGEPTIAALRARGHAVEIGPPWTMTVGGMQGIAIDAATGALTGGADPRRDGYVATPGGPPKPVIARGGAPSIR
jgi:gamma-glutamyltranspeptidase / glutathione hydrolase